MFCAEDVMVRWVIKSSGRHYEREWIGLASDVNNPVEKGMS
jgi:hypothetical protein